jgi:hypothetical protein
MNDSEGDSYYSDDEDDMMDVDINNGPGGGYYDEEEEQEEERRDGGHRQNGPVGAQSLPPNTAAIEQTIEQRFKIRDGEMDVDSKLGRIYRADAKTFYKNIPDKADQKMAKAAFNLWDSCAENAWDRHRWDRPSKTQNDEPHVLGQLNKLFDLAKKYKKDLGFPFPKWVPGGGTEAFTAARKAPVVPAIASNTNAAVVIKPKPKAKQPSSGPGESSKAAVHVPLRNRMVDDGGHGKESDKEESDDDGDDFMVPDGPLSGKSDSEEEQEEKDVEVTDLVGGSGSGSKKKVNPFLLPESQSPIRPCGAAESGPRQFNNNRALIADSDDDDEEEQQQEDYTNNQKSIIDFRSRINAPTSSAAAREIARLSAWNWDSRKEEHPPNADVYGLADGKRSRRQRFTASQIVDVLGGSEEQQELPKKPRQRSTSHVVNEEEEGGHRQQTAYDSSSSDDDVPLAAQFSKYRTTPGSNEPEKGTASKTVTAVTPLSAAAVTDELVPATEVANGDTAPLYRDDIAPAVAIVAVAAPTTALPAQGQQQSDPSSAERAAVLARALLGTLYKPSDAEQHEDDLTLPSLPVITRVEEPVADAASDAADAPPADDTVAPPSSGSLIGIVPDSQEDDDIFIE